MEGGAASEAEQILLKSLKQDELRNKKLMAEKEIQLLQTTKKVPNKADSQFNVLKISDILDSLDEPMIRRIPRPKTKDILGSDAKPAVSPIPFDSNAENDPEAIDRMVAEEMFRLEEMKLAIQRKAQDEKLRLERQKKVVEIEFQRNHPNFSQPSVEIELDIQKKLVALAQERVLRSAAQRAEIEQKTRELEAIEARSIPFNQLPTFREILPSQEKQKSVIVASPGTNGTRDDLRHKRVQHILNEVNNPEQLEQRRKKIQQLREENREASADILDQLMKQPPGMSSSPSVPSSARLAVNIDGSDNIGPIKENTPDMVFGQKSKFATSESLGSKEFNGISNSDASYYEVE